MTNNDFLAMFAKRFAKAVGRRNKFFTVTGIELDITPDIDDDASHYYATVHGEGGSVLGLTYDLSDIAEGHGHPDLYVDLAKGILNTAPNRQHEFFAL